jgi:hypothetical protein
MPKHTKPQPETPSLPRFGSRGSMVVLDLSELPKNNPHFSRDHVICQDPQGYYRTLRQNVDSGMMDPFRCQGYNRMPFEENLVFDLQDAVEALKSDKKS